MAGALILEILRCRPWRTSWLIVGTKTLLLSDVPVVREPRRSSGGQARDGALIKSSGGWTLGPVRAHADRGPLLEATSAECISGPKNVSNRSAARMGRPEAHLDPACGGGREESPA